jgi:VWFA-related protein
MAVRNLGQGFFLLSFLMSLAASAPAAAPAQDAVSPRKPLQHEVAVTLKLVQVYVTDKDGRPAMDLGKSDFRLYDNGQLVTITDFEVRTAAETPRPAAPAAKAETARASGSAAQMGRKFFFFFDHDSNDFAGIAKARNAALHFLDTEILPTDEAGVISHAFGPGLVMHCFLTTDHTKVREAILRVRDIPGRVGGGSGGANTSGAGRIAVSSRSDTGGGVAASGQGERGAVVILAPGGGSTTRNYTDRMTNLARALRYIPGTKHILYFSQGCSILKREVRERLEEMSREFAAANAPLYTINTETPDPFNDDEKKIPTRGSLGQAALAMIAEQSGGKSYEDVGTIQRIPEIAADIQALTRNYYVLGFPIRQSWDGKYHNVKIEISRPEYRVQTQSGYYNPKPFSDYTEIEKELHLFDLALSEKPAGKPPLLFPMRILRFESGEESGVLLMAQIPPAVISAFAGRRIEVISLILDDQDNPAARRELKPDIDRIRAREVVFTAEASLKPGVYRCRIILRDLESGDAALAFAAVTIPAPTSAGGLKLFSPLLLTSYRPLSAWEEETKKTARRWAEIYSYDPAKYTLLAGDVPAGTRSICAVVPYAFGKLSRGPVSLRTALVDAAKGTRTEVPSSVIAATRKEGGEIQLIECGLEGIPAGKYLFYIYGEDASTQAVSYAQTALTIR